MVDDDHDDDHDNNNNNNNSRCNKYLLIMITFIGAILQNLPLLTH
jgi:hypothetical protein